jgi:hypothetical protein
MKRLSLGMLLCIVVAMFAYIGCSEKAWDNPHDVKGKKYIGRYCKSDLDCPAGQYCVKESCSSSTSTITPTTPPTGIGGIATKSVDNFITMSPDETTESSSAVFEFSNGNRGEDGLYFCQLDGGEWHDCSSGIIYPLLDPGTHFFKVISPVPDGLEESPAESRSWTIESDSIKSK